MGLSGRFQIVGPTAAAPVAVPVPVPAPVPEGEAEGEAEGEPEGEPEGETPLPEGVRLGAVYASLRRATWKQLAAALRVGKLPKHTFQS